MHDKKVAEGLEGLSGGKKAGTPWEILVRYCDGRQELLSTP
jgi:hypothetical protein